MLFISGDGLLSKEETKDLSLDLQSLRNSLFTQVDYYYNLLVWKSVSLSYVNSIPELSPQKIDLVFRIPQGEVSVANFKFKVPKYFIGDFKLEYLRIYDRDNGYVTFKQEEISSFSSFQVETNLPERPESEISSEDSLSEVYVSSSEIANWEEGYKVRLRDGSTLIEPVLTIVEVDEQSNKITFNTPPSTSTAVGKTLVFANNTELSLAQLIDFKDS